MFLTKRKSIIFMAREASLSVEWVSVASVLGWFQMMVVCLYIYLYYCVSSYFSQNENVIFTARETSLSVGWVSMLSRFGWFQMMVVCLYIYLYVFLHTSHKTKICRLHGTRDFTICWMGKCGDFLVGSRWWWCVCITMYLYVFLHVSHKTKICYLHGKRGVTICWMGKRGDCSWLVPDDGGVFV